MAKKIKIIVSIILCVLIVGLGIFYINSNTHTMGEKWSKSFIQSINYIKEGKYIDAYNNIKDGDKEEKNIIQTVILHKFGNQFDISMDINEKIGDEADHITDYLTYTYIYSKDPVYQQNIDKMYEEEYQPLFDIKEKIPKDILFDDCQNYYDLYFGYLNLFNGFFKNYEYKVLNQKNELLNKLDQIEEVTNELNTEYEKIIGLHPRSAIPEEYRLVLDI